MKKSEWIEELNALLTKARKESWAEAQDNMINGFEKDELSRLELFSENNDVGYQGELLEIAQRYQGNWRYENNSSMTPVF